MFLYLARHAWAGHFGDPGWPDDSLRELTPKGIERYTRVVQSLGKRGFAPTKIATSPYTRCRQTADLIAKHTPGGATVQHLDALAPGGDFPAVLEWTADQQGHDVCWVGHNPDMEYLTAALLGDGQAGIRFAKGSIAAIYFDEPIANAPEQSAGVLHWHITAKALGL